MTVFAVKTAALTIGTRAPCQALNQTALLAPGIVTVAAAYRSKDVLFDGRAKTLWAGKPLPSSPIVLCRCNCPSLPELSMSTTMQGPNQHLHACFSKGKMFSHLSAASTSLFGDQGGFSYGIPRLPVRKSSSDLPRAYKNDFVKWPFPVVSEKPEWWWRTLACLPYLLALQISHTGYIIQPFLEHHEYFRDLVYFVPGAFSRLPTWFIMVYCYIAYIGIVKNREWPHFFRFHLMMGMLLETALQLIWHTSNFFPLIHYNGTYGMYYWAGVGLAYMLVLLECVRCALAGGYSHIPVISDAALIHTQFNIGGFQRPF